MSLSIMGGGKCIALVLYRGVHGDAPAIMLWRDADIAHLMVFDAVLNLHHANGLKAEDDHVVGRLVYNVPRGLMEGTEPRPSWYEPAALP